MGDENMELRYAALTILVGATVSTPWPGTALAEEQAAPLTVAEQAVALCRPAVDHAVEYFEDLPIDDDEVAQCEVWTVLNATEGDLDILTCLADASDAQIWATCLVGYEPTVPWRRELMPGDTISENRYGILDTDRAELDRQIAENAGVLAALSESSELEGIFGAAGFDSDLTGGIGGLIGAKYGEEYGTGGLGSRGSGLGGGGTAEGLGGLGTKGRGSGSGYGTGGGSFGTTHDSVQVSSGDPIILGALDRELIDAVIRRHMNQVRYCYQRELTRDPNITGEVVVKFEIAADGTVTSAEVKSTTMNHEAVQSCVVGRFMRMQFPGPKGGGIVIVSYPLVFTSES
jgi:TonB family protein